MYQKELKVTTCILDSRWSTADLLKLCIIGTTQTWLILSMGIILEVIAYSSVGGEVRTVIPNAQGVLP